MVKKKYNLGITDLLNSTYKVDGWEINDYTDGFSDDGFSSYNDLASLINIYYDWVEEAEEQKQAKLAKEKAEKRNTKIDQILGDGI